MQPHEKAALLKALRDAETASVEEQDIYREVMSAIEKAPVKEAAIKLVESVDWEQIERHMSGYTWPPTSTDWWEVNLSPEETPKHEALSLIADPEIRHATYMCSEISDHTLRLKAIAHFYSLYGVVHEDVRIMFLAWTFVANWAAMQSLMPSIAFQPQEIESCAAGSLSTIQCN